MQLDGYLENIELFVDANDPNVIYGEVVVPSIGATTSPYKLFADITDEKFKSYLRQFLIPNTEGDVTVSSIIQEIKDIIALGGNPDTITPRVRTAGTLNTGLIEYDLNNHTRDYVKITSKGWKLTRKHKHKFLKRNTLGTQVTPQHTQKSLLELLKPFVNTDTKSFILFTTWLVQAFSVGNHSALLIMAEKGSGKSTLTKMARTIVDPSKLNATTLSEKKDDLFSALSNSYFVAFDNTEELSTETSNILCSAVTGATMAKRKLYTTNELGVYELHNTVILNGIDIIPTRSDLASRCLLIKLKSVTETKRMTDSYINSRFNNALPEILGAIFNTLSQAMNSINIIAPQKLPRMAEAYTEMLAIAIALGISESTFNEIYFENLDKIDKERKNIAIVDAIIEYMESPHVTGKKLQGTVTEIFNKVCTNYSGQKNKIAASASHFSRKLRREYSVLYAAGYTVNFDNTDSKASRIEIIKNK